jgi:predicted kinase
VRVTRVSARSRDASDADAAVAREQETYDPGPIEWTTVDASGDIEGTVAAARRAVSA